MKRYWLRGGFLALSLYILGGLVVYIHELQFASALTGLGTLFYFLAPWDFFSSVFSISILQIEATRISTTGFYVILFGIGALAGHIYHRIR